MANPPAWKIVYGIAKWSTLAVLVIALVLILHKSPAPNVPYDANAGARVEQKFAAADQAKAAGEPAQVQLDRTELNSYLHDNLALEGQNGTRSGDSAGGAAARGGTGAQSNPAAVIAGADQATVEQVESTVKDVRIDMEGELIKAYVIFDFHGKDLSLELDGRLGAQNGYIKFEPVAGKLGSLPLPQSTLDSAVQRLMASPENREKLKLPADIADLHIVDGQVVVTYKSSS